MNKRLFVPLSLVLLAALTLTGLALAVSGPAVEWQVIASGSAPSSGGNVTLNDTLGQPIIGPSSGGSVDLGAGYWYGLGNDETKCNLLENTVYAYHQTWPISITLQNKGAIACLRVRRYDQNHANATGTSTSSGVGWGRYWTVSAIDSLNNPATGFTLTLTLPRNGETTPSACRYPGGAGGAGWDCGDAGHVSQTANSVTRSGVTALSDWAVGNTIGPTAVTIDHLAASTRPIAVAELPVMLALAVLIIGGCVAWFRRSDA